MDPQLDTLLKKAYSDATAKGITGDARQQLVTKLANDYNGSKGSDQSQSSSGFLGGLGRGAMSFAGAVAKPFINVGSTIEEGLGTGASALFGGQSTGVGRQFASQAAAVAPNASKNAVQFAGNTGEALSYFIAPVKGVGGGFWGAVKAIQPAATAFGVSKAVESAGEGDSLPEAALKGVGTYAGISATAGLFGYGGDFVKQWGAKLMQNEAVQASFKYLHDFADNAYAALPEVFQPGKNAAVGITDTANKNVARTAAALEQDFNKGFTAAKDSVIDASMPTVDRPEVQTAQFNHAVSQSMGDYFKTSNALYDNVKADATTIGSFPISKEALDKLPAIPTLGAKTTPEEMKAYQAAMENMSPGMQQFGQTMKAATGQPLTLRQVMGLWQEALSYIPEANNGERASIRDFAAGLYSDAKATLSKTNPALLNDWEAAWSKWGDASRLYDSPVLNELKNPGNIDNYIAKITSGTLTPLEQEAIGKAISDPGTKGATQDLLMGALLRQAKLQKPQEASKTINAFLDKFGDTFMTPDARALLGKMGSFFDSNFSKFVEGMQNHLPGLSEDAAGKLDTQAGQMDAFDKVSKGGLDQITAQVAKMKDSPDFAKIVTAMDPEEKQAVGLAVTKDFFDKNMPLATQLPNGKYQVEKGFADSIVKTWNMLAENKGLQEAVGPDAVKAFEQASKVAENLSDASYVDTAKGLGKLYHALIASLYLQRGWIPGAISNFLSVAKTTGDVGARFTSIQDLVDSGLISKGKLFTIGDVLNHIGTMAAKGVGGQIDAAEQ